MSYDEIGAKMKLSRPAVESMLFRARRGLKEHFSEIRTGARCRRMQAAMAEIAEGMGSLRDRRLLLRHIRDCSACRRQATAMGFSGVALPAESGRFRDAVSRVAALLPLPFLFSRRPEDSDHVSGSSSIGVQAQGFVTQLSAVGNVSADHASSVVHKAAAVVAAVAVIGGGGVAVKETGVKLPVLHIKTKQQSKGSTRSKTRDRSAGKPAAAGGSTHTPADEKEGTTSSAAALVGPQETSSPSAAAAPEEKPDSAATPESDPAPEAAPPSDSVSADPEPPADAPADPAISFDSSGSGAPADTTVTTDTGSSSQVTDPPADTGGLPPVDTILLTPPDSPPVDTGGALPTLDGQSAGDPASTTPQREPQWRAARRRSARERESRRR
jgi:hypothetical protein